MGLSTADSKQVLCHMILFKVLSLGLLRYLWFHLFSSAKVVNYISGTTLELLQPLQKARVFVTCKPFWPSVV